MKSTLSMVTGDGKVYQKCTFGSLYVNADINLIFWISLFEVL